MTLPHRAARVIAPLLLLLAQSAPAVAQDDGPALEDVVVTRNGRSETLTGGLVTAHGYEGVTYEKGGRKQNVDAGTVVEIRFGDGPRGNYDRALRSLAQGDAASAKDDFRQSIAGNAAGDIRDWVLEYGNAGMGEAYLMLATRDPAARTEHLAQARTAFLAARDANPKSLILDRILGGLVEVESAAGDTAAALGYAEDLSRAGVTARRVRWELGGKTSLADTHRASGQLTAAAAAYQQVLSLAESKLPAAKGEDAQILEAARRRAAAQQGWVMVEKALESKSAADFDRATEYFTGLRGKFAGAPEVLAAAQNAEGVVKFEGGDHLAAARLFVETEVRWFTVPDEVARALYYQTLAYEKLGRSEDRARAAASLKESFPKSEWTRKLK